MMRVGDNTLQRSIETCTHHYPYTTAHPPPLVHHHLHTQGRPIYIQSMGSIDLKKILEVTSEERMVKFRIQVYDD